MVQAGELSAGQARALLGAGDDAHMESLARTAVENNWPVREVERRAQIVKGPRKSRRRGAAGSSESEKYEEQLRRIYGTRVTVRDNGGKGEVRFEFYTAADRDRLLHQLLTGEAGAAD